MSHPDVLPAPTEPYSIGDSIENQVTGERGILDKAPWEGEGPSLEVELHVRPAGAVVGEHIHHHFDERFTVTAGRIAFKLDGAESVAIPGETVEVPAGDGTTGGTPATRWRRPPTSSPPTAPASC